MPWIVDPDDRHRRCESVDILVQLGFRILAVTTGHQNCSVCCWVSDHDQHKEDKKLVPFPQKTNTNSKNWFGVDTPLSCIF